MEAINYVILFYILWVFLGTQYFILIDKLFDEKPRIFTKKELLYYSIPFVPYYKYFIGMYDFIKSVFSKRFSNFKANIKQIK